MPADPLCCPKRQHLSPGQPGCVQTSPAAGENTVQFASYWAHIDNPHVAQSIHRPASGDMHTHWVAPNAALLTVRTC